MRQWTTGKRTSARSTRTSPSMSLWTPSVVRLTSMLHPSLQLLHCCHLQFSAYNDCVPLSPVYRCPCCAQAAGYGSRSAGGSSWGTVAALYRALT